MALKLHIVVDIDRTGGRTTARTACGVPIFKGRASVVDEEWESGRVIGGVRAIASRDFYPDHGTCAKCRAKWMALEV